jgi:hypothetical protein
LGYQGAHCRQIHKMAPTLWTFLEQPEVEPTNNAANRLSDQQ